MWKSECIKLAESLAHYFFKKETVFSPAIQPWLAWLSHSVPASASWVLRSRPACRAHLVSSGSQLQGTGVLVVLHGLFGCGEFSSSFCFPFLSLSNLYLTCFTVLSSV